MLPHLPQAPQTAQPQRSSIVVFGISWPLLKVQTDRRIWNAEGSPTSASGPTWTSEDVRVTSAYPSTTDIMRTLREVRHGPLAGIGTNLVCQLVDDLGTWAKVCQSSRPTNWRTCSRETCSSATSFASSSSRNGVSGMRAPRSYCFPSKANASALARLPTSAQRKRNCRCAATR